MLAKRLSAGPLDETNEQKFARIDVLLEDIKRRAMLAVPYPDNPEWPKKDDVIVIDHVKKHGDNNWRVLEEKFEGRHGTDHSGRVCYRRWRFFLDPGEPLTRRKNSPADIVAAAYEEARNTRAAADKALASILDPVKLAQAQADASKGKPTTNVGRLIKAANKAATRAEQITADGGGDGRALRVPGF
jgi:hypothetical protein